MENTVEYQLGQLNANYTSIRSLIEEDKKVREENARKIDQINDRSVKLQEAMLRMDSWKDGQTLYMHETTEKVTNLDKKIEGFKETFNDRLKPLELEYKNKIKDQEENKSGWRTVKFSILQIVLLGFGLAVLLTTKRWLPIFISFLSEHVIQ